MFFIYVINEKDRDKMVSLGYHLLKGGSHNNIWVFHAKEELTFAAEDELNKAGVSYVLSNRLTF